MSTRKPTAVIVSLIVSLFDDDSERVLIVRHFTAQQLDDAATYVARMTRLQRRIRVAYLDVVEDVAYRGTAARDPRAVVDARLTEEGFTS